MPAPTGRTPLLQLPYPIPDDGVDVPRDVKALADALDALVVKVPIGAMMMWPTGAAPVNWLICNGASFAVAAYPELGALLGESPSGSGNFKVPNLSTRFPIGAGGTYALGQTGGEEGVALTTENLPAHTHSDGSLVAAAH